MLGFEMSSFLATCCALMVTNLTMPQVSYACKHVITSLLRSDPAERMTLKEVMRHPWYACTAVA